jgi:4-amino-4-deoxy-L-arabinose transferase-like glycosyltransferase
MAGNVFSSNNRIQNARSGELFPIVTTGLGKTAVLALTIASIAWFAFFAKALLLKYPPVSPDEVAYSNPAINLLHHGRMSTDVMDGTLPGIGQHTYWMPPIYFLYIASVFRFTGPGLVPLRLASLALGLVVLGLTYLLALRTGLGRWLSLLPVSLVAFDAVFLRGALIGRMDMLALAFVLLSLWLAMKSFHTNVAPSHSFLTGIVCALAALSHPMGAAAPASVTVSYLFSQETRTRRSLLPLFAGILIPFLPWLAYILLDPGSFIAQFGGVLERKISQYNSPHFLLDSYFRYMGQYVLAYVRLNDIIWVLPLWFAGMVGLADSAELALDSKDRPARRCLLLLFGCQALTSAVMLWHPESWYIIYVIPITAIGLCHLLAKAALLRPPRWDRIAITSLVLVWVGGFVWINLQYALRLNAIQHAADTDYTAWSAKISSKIPQGSKLLLSIIPDPYFGLMGRSDLSFREFLPERVPINHDTYWHYLSQADYIVVGVGLGSPSPTIEGFVGSNATLIDTVGEDVRKGYTGRVYRVNKPNFLPQNP